MANTIKFGNGQWATKKDSILAYNDENANFKPLPFVTSRASTATRVNKLGLIETVASGVPRVDYLDNSKGAYLLEPQSTNLFPYSEDFSNSAWNKSNTTITANQAISPDGTLNADKLVENSLNAYHTLQEIITTTSGVDYTFSVFVKKSERSIVRISRAGGSTAVSFNLNNLVVLNSGDGLGKIELFNNSWVKCSFTFPANVVSTNLRIELQTFQSTATETYQGDGTSGVYLFGAQVEQKSYATSYIKTSGSQITRLADTASQTVPDGVIGQTEGTIYSDVNFVGVTQSITNQIFFIRELNSNNGYIFAGFYQDKLNVGLRVDGSTKFDLLFGSVLTKGRYKIAVVYSSGDTKVFINGSKVGSTMTQTFGVNNFAQIYNGNGSLGTNQLGDINRDFRIYNTALTDAELAALTQV